MDEIGANAPQDERGGEEEASVAKARGALQRGDAPPLHEIPKLLCEPRAYDDELDLAMQPRDLFRDDARDRVVEPDRVRNERHSRTPGGSLRRPGRVALTCFVRHGRAVWHSCPGTNLACRAHAH